MSRMGPSGCKKGAKSEAAAPLLLDLGVRHLAPRGEVLTKPRSINVLGQVLDADAGGGERLIFLLSFLHGLALQAAAESIRQLKH
jgi:hypothetical protein